MALFAVLPALFVPRWSAMRSTLPVGRDGVATVPLFNVWTIWWNCDRLQHGFADYWDAPIFAPEPHAFAFSEPQPATLLMAPVIWLSGSRILAYNVYLWLSLALNGLVTTWVLLSLGHRLWLAVLGGIGMLLLPIVHAQIDVLQLVPLWGILWTWSALQRLGERPSWQRGVEAGVAVGLSYAMSIHHGMFLSLLLLGPVLVLPHRWREKKLLGGALVAAAVGSLFILPLVLPMRSALSAHAFQRSLPRATGLSAKPDDYLILSEQSLVRSEANGNRRRFQLSPGWIKLALAGVGLVAALLRRRRRRWTIFLVLTALLAFCLSLGPHLQIGGYQPWETLRQWCPGMAQVRSVFRFAYFVQMAVVLLAIEGAHLLWLWSRRRPRSRQMKATLSSLVMVLTLAAMLEAWPRRPALAGTPSVAVNREWIDFIRRRTDPGRTVVGIPFAGGSSVQDFVQTTRWMFLGTYHGVRMVNGYSGFFPKSNEIMRDVMQRGFASPDVLVRLEAAGVEFLIVQETLVEDSEQTKRAVATGRLEQVHQDKSGVVIYRLVKGGSRKDSHE